MPTRPLNPRQRRFVEEYRQLGNGTQAAIRAGYYRRHAAHTASALMRRPDVRALLDESPPPAPGAAPTLDAEAALEELARIAFANMLDFTRRKYNGGLEIDWDRMSRGHAAGIRELIIEEHRTAHGSRQTLRIRMADKQAALARLIALSPPRAAPGGSGPERP